MREADVATIGAALCQIVLFRIEVILTSVVGIVATRSVERTANGQVGGRTSADVNLTRNVDVLVGRVVQETGLEEVVLVGVSGRLVRTGAATQS